MASTIRGVAARAGVSSATVSLVLSGKARGRVSAATADRVRDAATVLGYRNRRPARAAGPLGILNVASGTQRATSACLDAARDTARHLGLEVLTLDAPDAPDAPAIITGLQRLADFGAAGVLIVAGREHSIRLPQALPVPVVLLDAGCTSRDVDSVVEAPHIGQRAVLDQVAHAGHKRVGWICHQTRDHDEDDRCRVFRQATTEHGWDDDPARIRQISPDDIYASFEAMRCMFEAYPRVTAVACESDRLAMGVYQACWQAGLTVPEDISVVGFGDLAPISQSLRPELTTVIRPSDEMGCWAVMRVLDQIRAHGQLAAVQVQMASRHIVGASLAPPRCAGERLSPPPRALAQR